MCESTELVDDGNVEPLTDEETFEMNSLYYLKRAEELANSWEDGCHVSECAPPAIMYALLSLAAGQAATRRG